MRAFVALDLPDAFAAGVAALARRLSASLEGRFLPRENHHLTLAFLGELAEGETAAAHEALEAAAARATPLPLRSEGLGKFGRQSDATLWLGVACDPALMQLAALLREELAKRGLSFDDKPFKPHVTLARRVRIPKAELPPLAFPLDDEADRVSLYKSTLGRDGAAYKPLHTLCIERPGAAQTRAKLSAASRRPAAHDGEDELR